MDLKPILDAVLQDYPLPWDGAHGIAHWARVLENGLRLADETGAQVEVVSLFSVLHDSQRVNDYSDPQHGPRAAQFAHSLRGSLLDLSDREFELLRRACHGHTHERTHPDITIQTCWDADRLDLGRVGVQPHPSRLCTDVARRPDVLKWADGRACFHVVPAFVKDEWGIDLETKRENAMAFSESLADRVRFLLDHRPGIAEKQMFGSICFMLHGNLLVGVWTTSLIVRVGPDAYERALQQPHVREFDITGRAMKGWVLVGAEGIEDDSQLQDWIDKAVGFVATVPRK
jgi:uncharacterized protein